MSVSALSDLPFSIFWEFSGCVGPCDCAQARDAARNVPQTRSDTQNRATIGLPASCGARYLNLAPTSAAGLAWLWAALQVAGAILPLAQLKASAACVTSL